MYSKSWLRALHFWSYSKLSNLQKVYCSTAEAELFTETGLDYVNVIQPPSGQALWQEDTHIISTVIALLKKWQYKKSMTVQGHLTQSNKKTHCKHCNVTLPQYDKQKNQMCCLHIIRHLQMLQIITHSPDCLKPRLHVT